jgi:hypothetical protein
MTRADEIRPLSAEEIASLEQTLAYMASLWSDDWVALVWPEWIASLSAVERLAVSLETLRKLRDNPHAQDWQRGLAKVSVWRIEERLAELMPLVEAELRRRGDESAR